MPLINLLSNYTALSEKDEFINNGSLCIETEEDLEAFIKKCEDNPESIFQEHITKETNKVSKKEGLIQNDIEDKKDLQGIEAVINDLKPKTKLIFRGVNEASYRLYTSAQRAYDELKLDIPYSDFIQFYIDETRKSKEICNYFVGKKYQITDFLILSLLQHYGYPTPLLDFSYDIYSALFFAIDNMKEGNNNEISNYVSLYIINKANDIFPDIFQVNHNDGENAQWLLEMESEHILEPAPEMVQDFERLPYDNYKDSSILLVSGGKDSTTGVCIPTMLDVKYHNTNPNLQSQDGLFVYISSLEKSLDRVIYKQTGYRNKDKIICVNINKKLRQKIVSDYLNPHNINKGTMYPDLEESKHIAEWLRKCNFPSITEIYKSTKLRENIVKKSDVLVNTDSFL